MDTIICEHSHGGTIEIPKGCFQFRIGAYALILHHGQMLMMRIRHTGRLFVIGGGVHVSETLAEGLHREAFEETGLQVEIGRQYTTTEHFYYWAPTAKAWHAIGVYYECTLKGPSGPLVAGDPGEGLPEWVPAKQVLAEDLHGSHPSVIKRYLQEKGYR
jgi:8-oxo-dGTP pyrophosphatase MutT (NUDIX family)